MDTYKEKQTLDELYHKGNAPWVVWNKNEITETLANQSRPGQRPAHQRSATDERRS